MFSAHRFIVTGNEMSGFEVKDTKTGEVMHTYEHFDNASRDAAYRNHCEQLGKDGDARQLLRKYRQAKAKA